MEIKLPVQTDDRGDKYVDLTSCKCSATVLCYNKGSGLVPIRITSAHRIYLRELEDIATNDPEIAEITVIPITEYITVAKL